MKKIRIEIKAKTKGTLEEYQKFSDKIIEVKELLNKMIECWKIWKFTDE